MRKIADGGINFDCGVAQSLVRTIDEKKKNCPIKSRPKRRIAPLNPAQSIETRKTPTNEASLALERREKIANTTLPYRYSS